jgi:hypothetical protein
MNQVCRHHTWNFHASTVANSIKGTENNKYWIGERAFDKHSSSRNRILVDWKTKLVVYYSSNRLKTR